MRYSDEQKRSLLRGAMPGGCGVAALTQSSACRFHQRPATRFFSTATQFTALRRRTGWLQDLPANAVKSVLRRYELAWDRAFEGGGFPRFHSRHRGDSFDIHLDSGVRAEEGRLWMPRLGWVKLRGSSPYEGCAVVKATVFSEGRKWYAAVCYKVPAERIARCSNGLAAGLDRNVGQVASSDGAIRHAPRVAVLQARKNRYQRMMARRRKGSRRRALARHRLARVSRKLAMTAANWQHHTSKALAADAGTVVIEALDIPKMTKSARGTVKRPGSNVRAKARLNRGILATGWGGLKRKLDYKAAHLIEVDPAYTSQACSHCGHVDKDNRRSQKRFECVSCGRYGNADVNAAWNILARGTGAAGRRGAWAQAPPMNRQQDMPIAAAPAVELSI